VHVQAAGSCGFRQDCHKGKQSLNFGIRWVRQDAVDRLTELYRWDGSWVLEDIRVAHLDQT
jgi:hypothetical protein